jgi:hypothetical protein
MGGVANTVNIAFWNTSTSLWNAMGNGVITNPNVVSKMISDGTYLYWFGSFLLVNSIPNTVRVAKWDIAGSVWSAMGTGIITNTVLNAVIIGTNVWFCGSFGTAGGATNTQYLARWDGSTWNGYGASQLNNPLQTMQQVSAGNLALIGAFTLVGTTSYYCSVLFNTSTNAFSTYGGATTNANTNSFLDTDNTLWLIGNYTNLAIASIGNENYFYPTASNLCFYNTMIGKYCPLFTNGTNNINAMERTNVAGEYWMAGDFTSFDGYSLTGLASLMRFNKPNLIMVDSNLVQNGVSSRNRFGMTYKGQSIDLLNLDNSKWVVVGNYSPSTSTSPVVIFY